MSSVPALFRNMFKHRLVDHFCPLWTISGSPGPLSCLGRSQLPPVSELCPRLLMRQLRDPLRSYSSVRCPCMTTCIWSQSFAQNALSVSLPLRFLMDFGLPFGVPGRSFSALFEHYFLCAFPDASGSAFCSIWLNFGSNFGVIFVTFRRPLGFVIFATPSMRNHCF